MDILLEKYALAFQLQQEQQNRDNLQASILHFFCVLFKDGDLKSSLSGYMVNVFSITISAIESSEWTIRFVHFVILKLVEISIDQLQALHDKQHYFSLQKYKK